MKKNLKKAVILLSLFYFFIALLLFIFQKKLEYHPSGQIANPSSYSLAEFQEVYLVAKDGLRILSWYKAPKKTTSSSKKIIVYFHGNSGNLSQRSDKFKTFSDAGFGVMAISYRGFAGSEGDMSEGGIINDAKSAMEFLLANNYQEKNIILFGESLGTGVAVQMAALFNVYAVVLESPFSSITSVAQKKYWFAPISLILKDKFDSEKYADKILSPVLIFHGTDDLVVPYDEAEKLYRKIKSPKKFITIKGGGHLKFGNEFLLKEIVKFFQEISGR